MSQNPWNAEPDYYWWERREMEHEDDDWSAIPGWKPEPRPGRCATCQQSGDADWTTAHAAAFPQHEVFHRGQLITTPELTGEALRVECERRR